MHPSRLLILISCLASAPGGLVLPAAAGAESGSAGLSKPERVHLLLPVYRQAKADPALAALERAVDRRDPATIDAWLRALPLSPLDEHAITRHLQRSEHPLRRPTLEYHRRWLALHPEEGRRLHGDLAVEEALRGYGARTPELDAGAAIAPDAEAASAADAGSEAAAAVAATVGPNRNVAKAFAVKPFEYQGEIQLVVDPRDPQRMVAAANTWDDMGGACGALGMQAVFHSTNGGATWAYTCSPDESDFAARFPSFDCPGAYPYDFGSDPALAWGPDGQVYLEYMLLCLNNAGTDVRYSLVVASSADGGATWSPKGVVKDSLATGNLEDKNFYLIDDYPTSPYHGRHYTCWDRNNDEKLAYSTDSGGSWTEVDLPEPAAGLYDIGCDLAVTDDGTLHAIWNRLTCDAASCSQERMYHSRSTDGGAHWSAPVLVHSFRLVGFSGENCPPVQDHRCINSFGSIAVDNSGGACRGDLIVTYTDVPTGTPYAAGKANVYARRSSDGGASWSAPVKVNSDGVYSLNTQFHPWLEVDRGTGHAVAGWHDSREESSHKRVDYFMGRSAGCGQTWTDFKVSAASNEFNNSSISFSNENSQDNTGPDPQEGTGRNPNQYGEYLGLDALGGRAFMAWTDTRHFFPGSTLNAQRENVGFVAVSFPEIFLDGFETGDTRVWSGGEP